MRRSPSRRVYHRLENPRTQTYETALLQQRSGEIWGRMPQHGFEPVVQAYEGPLPAGRDGIEFETSVPPEAGAPPGQAHRRGPCIGVRISEDGQTAVLSPVVITRIVHEGVGL